MNRSLEKLNQIAHKEKKLIMGMMSGTSQDGVDLALCRVTGSGLQTDVQQLAFKTFAYSDTVKDDLAQVSYKKITSLEKITLLNTLLGEFYAQCTFDLLENTGFSADDIDLIASHGQTVHHAPEGSIGSMKINATMQIGDGDLLARKTDIITLSDFRQKDIAAGGEGAPLSGYAESLLFTHPKYNRLLINIGGISNGTFLPKKGSDSETISTDFGPGNTLIDAAVRRYYDGFQYEYDKDGAIASGGEVDQQLLKCLLEHPFLRIIEFPKSTGQEAFNLKWVEECVERIGSEITAENLIATLTQFTVESIAQGITHIREERKFTVDQLFVSGGGVHNKTLLQKLDNRLDTISVTTSEEIGADPNAKEALLFAVLANETMSGQGFRGADGRPFTMGKISLPI